MKTDKQIPQDVLDEHKWDPAVNAAQVVVTAKDGAATLSGMVETDGCKWAAERATLRVAGIQEIAVELEVELARASERKDDDIALAAETALNWNEFIPTDRIKIMVEKAWLILSGEVDWSYQRHWAADAVAHLLGATDVTNDITLEQRVIPTGINSNIEAVVKLMAAAGIDALSVNVDVNGGQVTMKASPIHSWTERGMINHAVWSGPGVTKVVDRTDVTC
jgi:osmotically-inducible protein OsmY